MLAGTARDSVETSLKPPEAARMSNKFPPELGELRVTAAAHDVGLEGGYEGNG
jgi:hypothetical protein